jgi:acetolactate synthase-1/2/3 large subunit
MSSDTAQPASTPRRSGGRVLADQLQILGADTIYCVPGESYLELLDGLHAHQKSINVVTCRHESGASNMADAYGKLTGKPGICAVTRGPGATNASNGVHTAFQDSTPMILLIGQVGREMVDREAFQEIDYRRMFGQMAKWVAQIDDAARIPEYMARAWKTALSGRPGPVVLALPEDMLTDEATVADLRVTPPARPAPAAHDIEALSAMIARAKKPMLMVGGPSWSEACADKALAFAERLGLPVTTSFRSQDYVNNGHDNYVGPVGIAPIPNLRKRLREEVDLLITVGPRLGEMTTQGYELIDIPHPQMTFVHVHPGAEELGQVYQPDLAIQSDPELFFDAAEAIILPSQPEGWVDWVQQQRADYLAFQTPTEVPGDVNMGHVVRHMSETLPEDTIYTNGAGNYTVWLHRFHQHRAYRTQLAPTSGSMGYGVPAAVAAKLAHPDRTVVAMAGDGCFMMTSQELATAAQHGADVIYVVVNNGMYGTIRMHQERHHPGKVMATKLVNPDFVAYAASFGIAGERVLRTEDFPAALERARTTKGGYMIEIVVDPEALTPNQSLSAVRAEGQGKANA